MKSRILKTNLFVFALMLLFASCTKDAEEVVVSPLDGEWNLTAYSAGLMGGESFAKDDITWTFNSNNNTVDVLINTTLSANSYVSIKTTSTHSYSVNGSKITIGTYEYDFYFQGRDLILSDHPELDGPMIKFERD